MPIRFVKNGSEFTVVNMTSDEISESLSCGIYKLLYSEERTAVKAIDASEFKLPNKIYGSLFKKIIDRVMTRYALSDKNFGVLFLGDAGAGKTLLSNMLCNYYLTNIKKPIIVIDTFVPSHVIKDLFDINIEVLFLMDEFGKNYGVYAQNEILASISGTGLSKKKMFVYADNNSYAISNFILNRPGRAFYRVNFGKLEKEVVEEYLKEYKVSERITSEILNNYMFVDKFSFDELQTIVTEHLQYPDMTFSELTEILNINKPNIPENKKIYFKITEFKNGEEDLLKCITGPTMINGIVCIQQADILKRSRYASADRSINVKSFCICIEFEKEYPDPDAVKQYNSPIVFGFDDLVNIKEDTLHYRINNFELKGVLIGPSTEYDNDGNNYFASLDMKTTKVPGHLPKSRNIFFAN